MKQQRGRASPINWLGVKSYRDKHGGRLAEGAVTEEERNLKQAGKRCLVFLFLLVCKATIKMIESTKKGMLRAVNTCDGCSVDVWGVWCM